MKIFTFGLFFIYLALLGCSDDSATWKERAEQSFQEGEYGKAIEYLKEAESRDPQNQEIQYYLGQTYRLMMFDDGSTINMVDPALAPQASAHFRKAIEISPRYEGRKFIVDPYTKIQSVWGSLAVTYLYHGQADSAVWAFRKGQAEGAFYPAIMEYNKNMMASCEPNAIIFTNGDNDTYPMWYLQLVEGYRKDITVVNLSLLNVSWYEKQLKNGYPFGDNNIAFTLTDEELDTLRHRFWNEQTVTLPVSNDPRNPDGKMEWVLKPTASEKVIRVQDILLIDILDANAWKRPVYFAITVSPVNKIGLEEYLVLEGTVFELKTHKEDKSLERLRENCSQVYTYDGIYDDHLQYIDELKWLFFNYRAAYAQLAKMYYDAGQIDEAQKTLQEMEAKLPEDALPYPTDQIKEEMEKLYQEISSGA
jgi:tetratricopeptide (TPR) repeat protein